MLARQHFSSVSVVTSNLRVASQSNNAKLVAMGLQMGNTVISTYIVDCYPLQSMSIITFYSVILDLSAFINPVSSTTGLSKFSTQAIIDS